MANWKARHEGSPQHVEIPFVLLTQGLMDGEWEPTDEVMGPGETRWVAIESHPALAELAEDIEPPPPPSHDEEAHLDMNALIDVCMVMLIFFILTTSVAAMQKQMEAPTISRDKAGIKIVTDKEVQRQMIHVVARMTDGEPVILVEKKAVPLEELRATLRGYVNPDKTTLLLEHDDLVPQDIVVQIIDKAKAAGLQGVQMLVP